VRLDNNIASGEIILLTGTSLLITNEEPASAVMSVLILQYADGSGRDSVNLNSTWRTDPLLMETPDNFHFLLPHLTDPVEIQLNLRISEYGNVSAVESRRDGDTSLTPDQNRVISKQLEKWHFFPAVEGGNAVKSDLHILMVYRPKNALPINYCFQGQAAKYPSKFALVTLEPNPHSPESWITYYGGFHAGGKFPINIVQLTQATGPL